MKALTCHLSTWKVWLAKSSYMEGLTCQIFIQERFDLSSELEVCNDWGSSKKRVYSTHFSNKYSNSHNSQLSPTCTIKIHDKWEFFVLSNSSILKLSTNLLQTHRLQYKYWAPVLSNLLLTSICRAPKWSFLLNKSKVTLQMSDCWRHGGYM